MKKAFNFITIFALALVAGVMNIILFLTIPEGRSEEKAFWFVWIFTFGIHFVIWAAALLYLNFKKVEQLVTFPITLTVLGVGFAVYAFVGFKFFFYAPKLDFNLAIMIESVLTAIFIIAILLSIFAIGYIGRNQSTVKEKVLFIRLLQSDVNGAISFVKDPELIDALNKLSEKIRFSDPMSHASLKGCEDELSGLVASIQMKARMGEEEAIASEIQKINVLLDYRNERCKILK